MTLKSPELLLPAGSLARSTAGASTRANTTAASTRPNQAFLPIQHSLKTATEDSLPMSNS